MDNGNDNILEMYLYETNTLLEQLDGILLNSEQANTFTQDDVNEILPHHAYTQGFIRYDGVPGSDNNCTSYRGSIFCYPRTFYGRNSEDLHHELFNLMFLSTDFFRSEVKKLRTMNPFLKISTHSSQILIASCRKLTEAMNLPLPLHRSRHRLPARRLAPFPVPKTRFMCSLTRAAGSWKTCRAYMLVTALTKAGVEATYEPSDVDSNPDSAATIVDKGFLLHFLQRRCLAVCHSGGKGFEQYPNL